MTRRIGPAIGIALTLALAGCGGKAPPPATPAPAPEPGPLPDVKDEGPALPPEDGEGGFTTINSGVDRAEALWHLRSALNVAALNCDATSTPGIVAAYNSLLKTQKAPLSRAYAAEVKRFAEPRALDLHMTRLYNYFAQPGATRDFCAAAVKVAGETKGQAGDALLAAAPAALAQLEAPFQQHYRSWRDYRVALAAWRAGARSRPPEPEPAPQPAATAQAAATEAGAGWLVQLGAFSGRQAASGAWDRIRARAPGFASYTPRFEDVPGKALVRVRIGPAKDRAGAIAMCATAAAAGLDCLPIAG